MKRNKYSLSHYKMLTGKLGRLYPVGLVEVLPGDTFLHSTSMLVRLAPMAAPVMHPVDVRIHHWFVPHRLIWSGWEDFITGGADGDDASTIPQITLATANYDNKLANYFGIPNVAQTVSELPFRAYNKIFNEFYRDQDLVAEVAEDNEGVQVVSWGKDYFTTCRPWASRGTETTIPVNTGTPDFVDVDDVRRAFALKRFQENRARTGARYSEYLRQEYGVQPEDVRLDRPEYLGGGKATVSISEVLQTAPETGTAPTNAFGVGDMYGHGITGVRTRPYKKRFTEHGYVMSLLSIRPRTMYVNAVDRTFLRADREDFHMPELETIGQQTVWNGEIYGDNTTTPYGTFGYQDRYREYREHQSGVAGEFRNTLDYWHMGRVFGSQPTLNGSFVACYPSDRVFNVTGQDTAWMVAQHRISALRPVGRISESRII